MNDREQVQAYESFASVYDTFMDNVPYKEWGVYLIDLLKEAGVENGLVLDMGCGTGSITEVLYDAGYDMIAIDNSEEMLTIAKDKAEEKGQDILYLIQDMREFELYGTVGAVVSICDSMNYITDPEDLLEVFKLVNNYLDPEGIFIFDLNTLYKYQEILGDQTIAETREDCCFIWDNYYYPEEQINEYELSIFVREQNDQDGNLFRRYQETHYQRAYEMKEVKALLEAAGMKLIAMYDAFTHEPPKPDSERIYVLAQECGKEKIGD